jgi:AcrR family transcriptional regulator
MCLALLSCRLPGRFTHGVSSQPMPQRPGIAPLTALEFRDNVIAMKLEALAGASPPRPYRMRARADAAERTAARVMDAAIAVWREKGYDEFTLHDVARSAGVSLSTVMRRFSSKEGLAEAVLTSDRVGTQRSRDAVSAGDVDGAVRMIVADYEDNGDGVIRMLALEERIDLVRRVVEAGRLAHTEWVSRVFAPSLASSPGRRRRQVLQLVVATDVYTWKLLRRDRQLEVREVRAVMSGMCRAIMEGKA